MHINDSHNDKMINQCCKNHDKLPHGTRLFLNVKTSIINENRSVKQSCSLLVSTSFEVVYPKCELLSPLAFPLYTLFDRESCICSFKAIAS